MYFIEMERITKKLHKKGGVTVKGILVSIRCSIPGLQTETEILAERFFENADGMQLEDGMNNEVFLFHDNSHERKGKP